MPTMTIKKLIEILEYYPKDCKVKIVFNSALNSYVSDTFAITDNSKTGNSDNMDVSEPTEVYIEH